MKQHYCYEMEWRKDYSIIVINMQGMYVYYIRKHDYGNLLELFAVEEELTIEQLYNNLFDKENIFEDFWKE